MATIITGSDNITSLESKVIANLCNGNFEVSVEPSVFLPGGTSTSGGVQGASVKITNPLGVVILNYITSGFDIYPPMTSVFSYAIPTLAGNFQYGTYTIDVRLTDEDGTTYVVSKTVNICPPDPKNKNKKTGCLSYAINANCKDGKVVCTLAQPPTYKGTEFTSQVIDAKLQYPTISGLPVLTTTYPAFSVTLYEGEYIITGSTCVLYNYGDNVYFKIKYLIDCSKIVACVIDMCCVQAKFDELNAKLNSDCTQDEKDVTSSIILNALFYIKAAQGAADCGTDPSDYIAALEKLLGCICTCNCNDGSAVVDSTPATDIVIQGCNVERTTVGLTKVYDINVYDYSLINDDADVNDLITLSAVSQSTCAKNQHINFDLAKLLTLIPPQTFDFIYRGLLSQTSTSNPTEVSADSDNSVTAVWTRTSTGLYIGTLSGLTTPLTSSNTFVITSPTVTNCDLSATYNSANSVKLTSSVVDAGIPTDGLLVNTPIEISILNLGA